MTALLSRWFRLLLAVLLIAVWLPQPGLAAPALAQAGADQNAIGQPIQAATESDLSDIPNLERVDYDSFRETFGEVPGEHVPLINPDNEKVQIKQNISGSEKTITTEDLQQN